MLFVSVPLEERFWEKVKIGEPDECWEWQACVNSRGYGGIRDNNTTRSAHRVAWELVNGPIPEDMHVLHKCDNPPCCNPAHLFLGYHDDNMRDMANKNRSGSRPGAKNPNAKISEEQAREIKFSTLSNKVLIEKYGRDTVYDIKGGRRWKHLTPTARRENHEQID